MTTRTYRRGLIAVITVCGVLLIALLVAAIVVVAASSQESARTAQKVSDDFAAYREVTESRSEKASTERSELNAQVATLAEQNGILSRQVAALTELLSDAGIDVPTVVAQNSAGNTSKRSSSAPSSRATPSAPRPTPAPTPAPAAADDPLSVCLPLLGCLL